MGMGNGVWEISSLEMNFKFFCTLFEQSDAQFVIS